MKWLDPKTNTIPTDIEDFLAIIDDPSDESCGYRIVLYVHQDICYHPKENFERKLFTITPFPFFLDEDKIIAWMPMPTIPLSLKREPWLTKNKNL